MDTADDANREVELQLATIETEDGDHHGQEHGTPTPSPSPTPSPDGALRLRALGKGLILGQRPAPPASGWNAQNRRGSTPVTSGMRGRPPLSAAAKHKNKNKAVTTWNDIVENFKKETKKSIDYMTMNQSRVAITIDMWTADSTQKGYMAITAHFIDDSWKLRSIIMRCAAVFDYILNTYKFIYVPAPHTADVICQELYDSLLEWNIDEKLMTVTVENCTTNDKAIEMIVGKIGKKKLPLEVVLDPLILEAVATRSGQPPALELLHTSLRRAHHPTSALVTSGKGGVGKTTTTANLAASLARLNFPVVVLDADAGLRNLDLLLGLENRVHLTAADVLAGNCRLDQALIRHPSSCAYLRPPWIDLRLLLLARQAQYLARSLASPYQAAA
ncbi:hypothetical protein ACQ4PT_019887 [Festuca glaucescens]